MPFAVGIVIINLMWASSCAMSAHTAIHFGSRLKPHAHSPAHFHISTATSHPVSQVLELVEKRHLAACGDRERGSVGGAEGGVAGVAADAAAAVAAGAAAAAGAGTEEPAVSLAITSCGEWRPGMPVQGYWDADDAFVSTAS